MSPVKSCPTALLLAGVLAGCANRPAENDARLTDALGWSHLHQSAQWHHHNGFARADPKETARLLDVIENPDASDKARYRAIMRIRSLVVVESPSVWAGILDSPRFDDDYKRTCLALLFSRHVTPGMRLGELAALDGVSRWITKDNIRDGSWIQHTSLISRGECVFVLQPPLFIYDPKESKYYHPNGGIDFSLDRRITLEELVEAVRDPDGLNQPHIVDLTASPGSRKSDL